MDLLQTAKNPQNLSGQADSLRSLPMGLRSQPGLVKAFGITGMI